MASGKGVEDLPDEILVKIFSYLTIEELAMTVQHVSSHWKEVSLENSLWKGKSYSPEYKVTDEEILQHLRNMPALKSFTPSRGTCTKRVVDTICSTCIDMQHITFRGYQKISNNKLKKILQTFPNLIGLSVPVPQYQQVQFGKIIGQFEKLATIEFSDRYGDVDENVLSTIADGCPSLQHVNFGYCTFQDTDIKYFLHKKRLQLLSLEIKCYISTLTFTLLCDCINLEFLIYENYNDDLPGTYMQRLSNLKRLEFITVSYFMESQTRHLGCAFMKRALSRLKKLSIYYCENFQGETLNTIFKNCPFLQFLTIHDNDLENGFENIGNCKNLLKLNIESPRLNDKCLKHIGAGCPNLRSLIVRNCPQLSDKAVEYICSGCPRLQCLDLTELRQLTDGIFEHLFKCRNLRVLLLRFVPNISGKHFEMIPTYLPKLEEIDISWCEGIDKECVEKLKEQMPNLKVNFEIDPSTSDIEETYSDIDIEDVSVFAVDFL